MVKKQPRNVFVKVLLDQRNSKFLSKIRIESENPFYLETPYSIRKMLIKNKKMDVKIEDNKLKIPIKKNNKNNLKIINSNELRIHAKDFSIKLNGTPYQGIIILKIIPKENKLFIINKLQLDDYIYSVLVSEIYQTWPHEMQKVQAVVSRTYAIYHMKVNKNRKKRLPYDIKKSNFHQRYNGFHTYDHLKEAIEETKGLIITHNNKIALAMFDACCGSIIPAKMDNLDFKKAPYLARKKSCKFCKNYSLYKWKRIISIDEFLKRLKENINITSKIVGCGKLLRIFVTKKNAAGIVKQVKLICSKKNIILSGNQIWDSMKNKILSLNFSINKQGDKIVINGKGFGHQIGLCQRGARELVNRGWDFKNIINFYYPGTNFSKLQYAEV
ncbi:SpoIID/LytB domain-containing protein [Candidatus Dependentiae bacterium]|nr:SpoIID/LytB domain-containing protein [Candidatus Dependentiae bacterium]